MLWRLIEEGSMDKLKLAFTWVIIIGIIGLGLYWISKDAEKDKTETSNAMHRGYDYAKGSITDIHSYKGHSIEVKYVIKGIEYNCTEGWDKNQRHLGVGDSVSLKYAIENPKLIVTELENAYSDTP
jgi:hypothetical protein